MAIVGGSPDTAYLRGALARAGRPADVELLSCDRLTEGRVNAGISRLTTAAASYIWKPIPRRGWSAVSLGAGRGEAELWLAGATRRLPAPLDCPTIDVADNAEGDEWWMLMDDVSAGIWPPQLFDEEKLRELMGGLARMHAAWLGSDELDRLPLASLDASTGSIARPTLHAMGGGAAAPWVEQAVREVWVVREMAPILLATLDPADADFFLAACRDRRPWISALERLTPTLVHGDLRRANISFMPDRISIFDWERATRGPAMLDLAWYWFLRFWAYPPAGSPGPDHWAPLLEHYVQRLEEARGGRVDRAELRVGWELGWLAVLAQIGWCLIDPLTSATHTADDVARVKRTCRDALGRARRAYDAHVR